jgi:smad nuclear-interacting protein 1
VRGFRDVDSNEDKKDKPNFGLSGALAAESNSSNGVVLKYQEPKEAALPIMKWRLYVYKNDQQLDVYHVSRQSAYLFGRDRLVADIPIDHPSCSKQHAVLQFRDTTKAGSVAQSTRQIKPFLIDLESTNKSAVNGKELPTSRYYELRSGDVITFGDSPREYVLLAEV